MFQVNSHSLVGASHRLAVQILKSAGDDIVAVISRRLTPHQPLNVTCNQQPAASPCKQIVTHTQPSLDDTKTNQSAQNSLGLHAPLTAVSTDSKVPSSVKLGSQQSIEKTNDSKERLTVDTQMSSSKLSSDGSLQSSSYGSLNGTLGSSSTRPSTSSTGQQGDRVGYLGTGSSLQLLSTQQDSKPQDQVICLLWFFYVRHSVACSYSDTHPPVLMPVLRWWFFRLMAASNNICRPDELKTFKIKILNSKF